MPDGDPDKYTNVTSQCNLSCQWTLTPNASYTPVAPLANGDADYAVMTGPDDTHTCSYTVTRPVALGYTDLSQPQYTLNPDRIYIPDPNSTGFIEVTANVHQYAYALHLAVDVTLDSSTVLFDTSLPVNEHWECTPIEVFNINKNDPDPWNQSSTPNP